jgi:site-specific recombinase XerD
MPQNAQQFRPIDGGAGPLTGPLSESYRALVESFNRKLLAENKSPRTIQTYGEALRLFEEFLATRGMPLTMAEIRREHVETFITDLLARFKPATASNRYRTLNLFFGWCVAEGEIRRSPMERMRPPIVPVIPPEVLSDDELRRIFRACEGNLYRDRRDMAIMRLLADTGMRVGELAGIKVEDLDLEYSVIVVLGKNRRPRLCPFGRKTSLAIDRYLRLRAQREDAHAEALWIGSGGPMTANGIADMVRRRGKKARVDHVHPHRFRHTFAHRWLAAGGAEIDLMQLAGWHSRAMVGRYGASAASERARVAYHRLALGDQI